MTDAAAVLTTLSESCELECKRAQGKDGQGKLPDDFWPTYSAFANSRGGVVVLGVREKPIGQFQVSGIANPQKVVTELFNELNNPKKVSLNLIADADVQVQSFDGRSVIVISVRRATRQERPVHVGSTPFGGNTYRRLHEGDRPCTDETVRRMLAERVEDERDSRILSGFDWDDIDHRSFAVYRQLFRDAKPTHPFLEEDDFGLLKKTGVGGGTGKAALGFDAGRCIDVRDLGGNPRSPGQHIGARGLLRARLRLGSEATRYAGLPQPW